MQEEAEAQKLIEDAKLNFIDNEQNQKRIQGQQQHTSVMIDVCLKYISTPESFELKIVLAIFSVLITGIGSGIYLIANLGPGPRDGLMTGLQKKTNLPIASVRAFLEISVVSIGWYLGGTVGVGTVLFAFGIGPCVAFGLFIVDKISTKK